NTITRAEFSKVVRTSLKLDLVKGNSFDDTNNHWAKNEIHTLVENDIIIKSEYGDNYEPTKNITRIEMAKMIVRAV
ncbi:S-layer homology domain-containing protein, partial [Caldisalinibacter kiritimatiensis]|uniref:S-layer homology domain-containing protein n=1 Tax=Caldisalinibacter kiritimatiensis TaxID=1304284 RepID=UPI00054F5EE6